MLSETKPDNPMARVNTDPNWPLAYVLGITHDNQIGRCDLTIKIDPKIIKLPSFDRDALKEFLQEQVARRSGANVISCSGEFGENNITINMSVDNTMGNNAAHAADAIVAAGTEMRTRKR